MYAFVCVCACVCVCVCAAGEEGRVHLQVREQHGRGRELRELLLHIGVVHERAPSVSGHVCARILYLRARA